MKRLLSIIVVLFFLSCAKLPTPANLAIGTVTSVEGDAEITREGTTLPAIANTPLFAKDIVETKAGNIKLTLNDSSTIALSGDSKIILSDFYLEENSNFRKSTINMAKGLLRSVVSKHFTAAGSEINIETPVIVAGIRGTELAITADDKESDVYCLDGRIEVYKPLEPQKARILQKETFIKASKNIPIEEPRPIPPEIRKLFFEDDNYLPKDFKDKATAFTAEYEANKAELRAKELEQKKKMEERREKIKDQMKEQKKRFDETGESQRSKMEEKRKEMERKMKDNLKK